MINGKTISNGIRQIATIFLILVIYSFEVDSTYFTYRNF